MRLIIFGMREILVEYTQSVKHVPARVLVFSPESPILISLQQHSLIMLFICSSVTFIMLLYFYFIHSIGRGHSHACVMNLRISVLTGALKGHVHVTPLKT
jgi:hypothetical protein